MKGAAEMLLGFPIRRAGIRFGQRGFTLVELAIALAVVGLLLGASLIPLRALDEARQLQDERRRLEVVRDAIVGYAQRHRTRARTVRFEVLGGYNSRIVGRHRYRSVREFHLPAGRPYLPCPDWDGDGFEDRIPEGADGFLQGAEAKPRPTVTETLIHFTLYENRFGRSRFSGSEVAESFLTWHTPEHEASPVFQRVPAFLFLFASALLDRPYGECRASRGAVPWRTLGVSPTDGWGNRHTYFVDPVFSNAMFGFDRRTVADIYDARVPKAHGFAPSRRVPRNGFHILFRSGAQGFDCPAVICDGASANSGRCLSQNMRQVNSASEFNTAQCAWATPFLVLKAGAVARRSMSDGRKYFPYGAVTEGIPFVLVSHGPNGRFAVRHWNSLHRPVDAQGIKSPVCNHTWANVDALSPFYVTYWLEERALTHELINGTRLAPQRRELPAVET